MKKTDISLGVLPVKKKPEDDEDNPVRQQRDSLNNAREIMEMMIATWEDQVAIIKMRAKLDRTHFEALCEAGFSEEEALDIIKAKGI